MSGFLFFFNIFVYLFIFCGRNTHEVGRLFSVVHSLPSLSRALLACLSLYPGKRMRLKAFVTVDWCYGILGEDWMLL